MGTPCGADNAPGVLRAGKALPPKDGTINDAMGIALEFLIILLLILLNGVFAMSELALVSARRARLAVLERKGVAGAALARRLAEDPQRFLPTVQVGVTLVGVFTGVFGGARIASQLERWLARVPRWRRLPARWRWRLSWWSQPT